MRLQQVTSPSLTPPRQRVSSNLTPMDNRSEQVSMAMRGINLVRVTFSFSLLLARNYPRWQSPLTHPSGIPTPEEWCLAALNYAQR